jgi:spore germination protein KC
MTTLRKSCWKFSKQMERQFSDILKQTQQMGCDIFGFGVAMHANNPEEWKKIKDKWTDYYRNAEVTTKVEAQIVKTGESKAPFHIEE